MKRFRKKILLFGLLLLTMIPMIPIRNRGQIGTDTDNNRVLHLGPNGEDDGVILFRIPRL